MADQASRCHHSARRLLAEGAALRTFAKGGQAPGPYIGIGDPVFQRPGPAPTPKVSEQRASARGFADYFRGSEADLERLEQRLAPLPNTAIELKAVAGMLGAKGSDVITGGRRARQR